MNPGDVGHAVLKEKKQIPETQRQYEYRVTLSEEFKGVSELHIMETKFEERWGHKNGDYTKIDEVYEILVIADLGTKKEGNLLAKAHKKAMEWLHVSGYEIVDNKSSVDVDTSITAEIL